MQQISTVNAIPKMTSNALPSGNVRASSELAYYDGWKAFDNINNTEQSSWATTGSAIGWLEYEFPIAIAIGKYSICSYYSTDTTPHPKSWTFEGSNDGVSWTILDTQTNVPVFSRAIRYNYDINNKLSYKRYRLNISANNGANFVAISGLEMFERIPVNKILISLDNEYVSKEEGNPETDLIPPMTSENENGFLITTSSRNPSNPAWKLFDGNTGSYWQSNSTKSAWVQIKLPIPTILSKYSIYKSGVFGNAGDWTFEGSNDGGVTWDILDTVINNKVSSTATYYDFPINSSKPYLYYRINVTKLANNDTSIYMQELKLYKRKGSPTLKSFVQTSEQNFINHGMDKSKELDLSTEFTKKEFIGQSPAILGSGKVFKQSIDTLKTPIKKVTIE